MLNRTDYIIGTKCNSSGSNVKVYEGRSIKNNVKYNHKRKEVSNHGKCKHGWKW